MHSETHSTGLGQAKTCQNCKTTFTIEPEDFQFYEKIQVPPPTWCPRCRAQRRMSWRNERFLFRRKDDHTGKEIFSMFPPASPLRVFERDFWISDDWDQLASGSDYDWSKPFFQQFRELMRRAPVPSRSILSLANSDYSNNASHLKNCYLVFGCTYVEDGGYTDNSSRSKDIYDSSLCLESEILYESFFNQRCYRALYSSFCEDCHDIAWCRDCIGCSNCFGCVGLRNKSYCLFNKQHSKEEYHQAVAKLELGSYLALRDIAQRVRAFWLAFPVRFMHGRKNANSSGEYISNSRNAVQSYYIEEGENVKYCQYLYSKPVRDSYDHYRFGDNSELVYESASCGANISRIKFCYQTFSNCADVTYSYNMNSCSYCFGCVGLHHKQYCILNKQYSREEYEKLAPQIVEHMDTMPYADAQGRVYKYGEYFPTELSPVPYNISIANEFFPLEEKRARTGGYFWEETAGKDYQVSLKTEDIPDRIRDVPDSITKEVLACAHGRDCAHQCVGAFRIIPEELAFYKHIGVALPRLCPNCRYFERTKQRAPLSLWHRRCMCGGQIAKDPEAEQVRYGAGASQISYTNTAPHFHGNESCPNEFETSYAPDRPEIVYCEACYNAEVV